MALKISKLHIHDPLRSEKVGEILIQPSGANGQADLFVLIEIDGNSPEDLDFIRQFLEIAFEAFERSQLHQTEKILENILQALNENLPPVAPKSFDWFKKLHCFVGLAEGSRIHFSLLGKINAYLIKPDGLKDAARQADETDKNNLFDSTFSGTLTGFDHLLVTTESLTDYISLEKIRKVVATLPPASAIAHLTNILESVPPRVSFFSLILKPQASPSETASKSQTARRLKIPTGSENSMAQLLATQAETEKILTSPSIFETIKESLKKRVDKSQREMADKAPLKKRQSTSRLKTIVARLIKTSLALKSFWLLSTQKNLRQSFFSRISSKVAGLIKSFGRLSKRSKVAIVLTLLVILTLSQSLIWQDRRLSKKRLSEASSQLAFEIGEKHQAVEASLIYNDNIRAKQLLKEMEALLNQLPRSNKEQEQNYVETRQKMDALFEIVWKITNVPEPVSLINFREMNLTAEISHLGFKDKYLYGFNNTNQVFVVNAETNDTLLLDNFNLKTRRAAWFSKNNSLIVSTDQNRFYTVDQNQLQEVALSLPYGLGTIDYHAFYLDKLYLLDRQNKQIYRLTADGLNFSGARSWAKEDLPLDQTVSLAVDGYVWALQQNGQVLKLAAGQSQEFAALVIEPALTAPTKIHTSESTDSLFILDPLNRRLVVFDKNGDLIRQYYSDKFNNLKDFIIDQDGSVAYLLNGSQVFAVSLK